MNTVQELSQGLSIWSLILDAGIVVQLVLLVLLGLSVVSWAVIFHKWRLFRAAKAADAQFSELFWSGTDMQKVLASSKDMPQSPQAKVFAHTFRAFVRFAKQQREGNAGAGGALGVRHALDSEVQRQSDAYARGLSFLATVGATAPFIGLFGTVWGIIDAFQNIGISQNTSLATVAPGIAEALVATAFGLLAAIPAVIAYNTFSGKMKALYASLDDFGHELMQILSQYTGKA